MYLFGGYTTIFFFGSQNIKKNDLKSSLSMAVWIFFSAAWTALNIPELNICSIDSYVQ